MNVGKPHRYRPECGEAPKRVYTLCSGGPREGQGILTVGRFVVAVRCEQGLEAGIHSPAVEGGGSGGGPSIPTGSTA